MDNLNFVAIDLETANSKRSSICEIGITVVENSQIKETKSWFVKPEDNFYDDFNIYIHGITPSMTRRSPDFSKVWKEIEPYVSNKIVVAHNVAFDMYALRDSFDKYNMSYPNFDFYCSYRLSTYILDGLYGYSLDSLCNCFNISREQEHRAGEDARACANIFMICMEKANVCSFEELEKKYFFNHGFFKQDKFISQRSCRPQQIYSNTKANDIIGDESKHDPDNLFYGKRICFTGALKFLIRADAMQIIADIGGIPCDSVTSKTDILVVGQQDYRVVGQTGLSSKQRKAIQLIDKGQKIDIISESDFIQNINQDDIKQFINQESIK